MHDIAPFISTDRITFDPKQYGGRLCIRELRIRVHDVLDMLVAGSNHADILSSYPDLEADEIRVCLTYAAAQIGHPALTSAE